MDEMQKLADMVYSDQEKTQTQTQNEPMSTTESIMAWIIVLGILCGIIALFIPSEGGGSGGSSELSKKRQAEKIIKSQLNYPSTYSLQGWAVEGNRVILEYKAKNAFGMEQTRRDVVYVD